MSETIDWTRPVETVDGRKCRVLCTDAKSHEGIQAVVLVDWVDRDELWRVRISDGHKLGDSNPFIRNVPEKFERTLWVNVYDSGVTTNWPNREDADKAAQDCVRIARLRVPITGHVGQFDE